MTRTVIVIAILLAAGAFLATLRHNRQAALNRASIENSIRAVKEAPRSADPAADARHRDAARNSNAGRRLQAQ